MQVGWGFTDVTLYEQDKDRIITPADKCEHLKAFCEQVIGDRPIVVAGASLGAAKAIDFAVSYPEVGSVPPLAPMSPCLMCRTMQQV